MENEFEIFGSNEEQLAYDIVEPLRSPTSPRSRKRKYDEMEFEAAMEIDTELNHNHAVGAMIDLSADDNEDEVAPAPVPALEAEPEPEPAIKRRKMNEEADIADANTSTLTALSQSAAFSDITFQVGSEQFFGLKAIFAIKSAVFRNILYPQSGEEIRVMEIGDISVDAFKFIRDFFYDLDPVLTFENVVDVLNAAKIYEIEPIHTQCNEFLNKIDNVQDLLSVLAQFGNLHALQTELNEILQCNVNLLQQNGAEIIGSEVFKALPFYMAKLLIESDNLGVSEEDLWNHTKHWLSANGDELKQIIRFCRMETPFIFAEIKQCGILNHSDLVSIYEKKLGLNAECTFNCNERIQVKPKKKSTRRKKRVSYKSAEAEEEAPVEQETAATESKVDNDGEGGNVEAEQEEEATPAKGRGRGRKRSTKKASAKKGRSKSRGRKK